MQRMEKNTTTATTRKKKEETSIRVDKETHELVKNLGRFGETYNDVLKRVLKQYWVELLPDSGGDSSSIASRKTS